MVMLKRYNSQARHNCALFTASKYVDFPLCGITMPAGRFVLKKEEKIWQGIYHITLKE